MRRIRPSVQDYYDHLRIQNFILRVSVPSVHGGWKSVVQDLESRLATHRLLFPFCGCTPWSTDRLPKDQVFCFPLQVHRQSDRSDHLCTAIFRNDGKRLRLLIKLGDIFPHPHVSTISILGCLIFISKHGTAEKVLER